MMKKTRKSKKGFTLVELMVVVAILGVLVAVAIPVYNGVTEKAEMNTCRANIRTIESAIMQAEIAGVSKTGMDMAKLTTATNGVGPFLKEAPICPKSKKEYTVTNGAITECGEGKGTTYPHTAPATPSK